MFIVPIIADGRQDTRPAGAMARRGLAWVAIGSFAGCLAQTSYAQPANQDQQQDVQSQIDELKARLEDLESTAVLSEPETRDRKSVV